MSARAGTTWPTSAAELGVGKRGGELWWQVRAASAPSSTAAKEAWGERVQRSNPGGPNRALTIGGGEIECTMRDGQAHMSTCS